MRLLDEALRTSTGISDWLQNELHDHGTIDAGKRSEISLALVSLALDHREAMILLVHQGARATAMAVIRPALEAYIRAIWARELATDQQLTDYIVGRFNPGIEQTMQTLRKKAHPSGRFFEALRKHYGVLSDYAHGGGRQVSRWIHRDDISPRYSDEQMVEALWFVDLVGLMAALARQQLLGHPVDLIAERLTNHSSTFLLKRAAP